MLSELQSLVGVIAFLGGLYAGSDLLFGVRSWRQAVPGLLARAWVCLLLTTAGVDQVVFSQNAFLQVGYLLGLPLNVVQVATIASLVVASLFWAAS